MSRWRILVALFLITTPVLVLAGFGSYFLWEHSLALWVWWPLTLVMISGYTLALYWQKKRQLLRPVDFTAPRHWTDRDHEAFRLVEARAAASSKFSADQLSDPKFYFETAQEMALELARFYHPNAKDPIGSLTIPEILAVIELASHDLAEIVDRYVPAGHLLTVDNWNQAKKATEWYQTASNVYWAASALFSPVNTGLRYAASRLGISRPWQLLQQNLIAWFYTAYVHRMGSYLIDLNSGRLRVGATRYRELMKEWQLNSGDAAQAETEPAAPKSEAGDEADKVKRITIIVMGQVKAGKSSFVNAVLGERLAETDVLPKTNEISRYELQPKGVPNRLVLLDTVGYGHTGPREDQLAATQEAARDADLLLMVFHAKNAARQADVETLKKLKQWFADRPDLRMPPILGIMTHIDLLSPMMEWSPPYCWQTPKKPKEQSIHDALAAAREDLKEYLEGIVPCCAAAGKTYGIEEWFLPAMTNLLDEARAVALLRCLRAEADAGKARKVFSQLRQTGGEAAKVIWGMLKG